MPRKKAKSAKRKATPTRSASPDKGAPARPPANAAELAELHARRVADGLTAVVPDDDTPELERDDLDTSATGPVLVAIGASAGGLEALKELLPELPAQRDYSYVIAQHLSPLHTSMMRDLLRPSTKFSVQDCTDGIIPKARTIYITPPNHDVIIQNGALRLVEPIASVGPKPSIDRLLRSMAEDLGSNAVSIILTGTGSDGAIGVRAIKAAGGVTIAQDPQTAKYDGMPRAAVQTGSIDVVAPVYKIGEVLDNIAFSSKGLGSLELHDDEAAAYGRIGALVKQHVGFSLSYYKPSTVNRRILRRMGLRKLTELEAYAQVLENDKDEASALARDILISVTSFFRDPTAFTALEGVLRQDYLRRKPNEIYRVWVPGCATGEEAYSIAILLSELKSAHPEAPDFLVFATDLDREAVAVARVGVYPEILLEQKTDDLRKRYFERQGNSFAVKKFLRQSMVFAPQNVVDDPPFSRIDLISCRNLLIYFEREVQRRVLQTFHYALNEDGYLFLGQSESIELHKELFTPVNKRSRIYRRRNVAASYSMVAKPKSVTTIADIEDTASGTGRRRREVQHLNVQFLNLLTQTYSPPSIAIDDQDRVMHFQGELDDFLKLPQGSADFRVYDLLRDQFRAEARALIHRCRRERVLVRGSAVRNRDDPSGATQLAARPLTMDQAELVVLSFEPIHEAAVVPPTDLSDLSVREGLIIAELERELSNTRQQLQTVVEELETSNEELQSQSEELQSANEELQSTNEELQTSNEELQSTNEELLTVNDEMQSKSQELEAAAGTLMAIKNSLMVPLLVLDERLNVVEFNNTAVDRLAVSPITLGNSVASIEWNIDLLSMGTEIKSLIKAGKPKLFRVPDRSGGTYHVHASPYRQADGLRSGATLLFVKPDARVADVVGGSD